MRGMSRDNFTEWSSKDLYAYGGNDEIVLGWHTCAPIGKVTVPERIDLAWALTRNSWRSVTWKEEITFCSELISRDEGRRI